MKVSVLIPSYGHAAYLAECLESLRAQTLTDWEAILVDDVSPDNSLEIAQDFERRDSRIHVYRNPENLGTYGTQQRALAYATAPYVTVLNSDDLWLPTRLEHGVGALEAQPQARFSFTLGQRIDSEGQVLIGDQHGDWPCGALVVMLPWLLRENRILASGVTFRREGLAFHSECRYSGDWIALLEAAVQGPAAGIAEPLVQWRQHSANSHRRSPAQLEEEIRIREAIRDRKWRRAGVKPKEIRAALAQNALHLAALYVLSGSMNAARATALRGLSLKPSTATVKRAVATALPAGQARKRLWPGERNTPEKPSTQVPFGWRA